MVHLELPNNWQDLATGYVLNNLTEEEAWIWNMLLQEYPHLHQEIEELNRAFHSLADVIPPHQPSPELLSKIHATIAAQDSQIQYSQGQYSQGQYSQGQYSQGQYSQGQYSQAPNPHPSHRQSPIPSENPPRPVHQRQGNSSSFVKRLSRRPRQTLSRIPLSWNTLFGQRNASLSSVLLSHQGRRWGRRMGRRLLPLGAVIAVGLMAVMGIRLYRLQARLQQTDTDLQQANAKIEALNSQLRQAKSLTQSTRPVVQTLQQPGSLIYSLAGSNLADTATGRLVMSEEQQVMIVVQNLPPLPEGQVYRLWAALQTKDLVYCGQFNSNAEGIIQLTPSSDHCGENPSQMIITLDAVTDPTTQGGPVVMEGTI